MEITLLMLERAFFILVAVATAAVIGKKTIASGKSLIKELDCKLQSIEFGQEKIAVYVGDKLDVNPVAVPKNAAVSYTWELADDGILTVSGGKIVAGTGGETILGVTSGDVSAQIRVIAKYKPLPPESTLPPLYYEKLKIANYKNTLSADYVPEGLIKIPDNYTADDYYGIYVTSETFEAYKKLYLDMNLWLPGDILLKADKMTMAHSLELRVPYLDREVWNVARTLTSSQKMKGRHTKRAFREAALSRVPEG